MLDERGSSRVPHDEEGASLLDRVLAILYGAELPSFRMKILLILPLALFSSACTVFSVAGTAVSTTVSVAGTVVETGVSVAGSAVRGVAHAVSGSGDKN
jgi:hypothetical protein